MAEMYAAPTFDPLDGWFASSTGASPDGQSPAAWASTVDFSGEFEFNGLDVLGPDDVAIYVFLVTPADYVNYPLRYFPPDDLPLDLDDAEIQKSFKGQWDPDIPARLLEARARGHRVTVWIWFGTATPDESLERRAQEQLDSLRLPPPWQNSGEY